ncbi:MAG: hypothetical protein ACOYNV_10575 [Propionivibrio sp.]
MGKNYAGKAGKMESLLSCKSTFTLLRCCRKHEEKPHRFTDEALVQLRGVIRKPWSDHKKYPGSRVNRRSTEACLGRRINIDCYGIILKMPVSIGFHGGYWPASALNI